MDTTPVELHGGAVVELARRALVVAACFLAVHCALRPVVRRFPAIPPLDRGDWLNRVCSITHATVTGGLSVYALCTEASSAAVARSILRLAPAPVDYVHGSSAILELLMPWTLGYFFYDSIIMAIDPVVYMTAMAVHHAGALVVWPIALHGRLCHVYVLYMLSTEVSSVLLHPAVFYLPKHGLGGTPVHITVGLALVAVFFVLRVLPVPFLLYSWWASREAFFALPAPYFWTAAVSLPVPLVLNVFWFSLLVNGALKQLAKASSKDEKAKQ